MELPLSSSAGALRARGAQFNTFPRTWRLPGRGALGHRMSTPSPSRQRGVSLFAYILWFHQARPTFAKWPGSQGDQEDVLQDLFYGLIGTANRFCVEFGGCPGVPGSNTVRLRSNNTVPFRVLPQYREIHTQWSGLLLEGSPKCRPKKFDHDLARNSIRRGLAATRSSTSSTSTACPRWWTT